MYKVHPQSNASAPLLDACSFPEVLKGLAWFVCLPHTSPGPCFCKARRGSPSRGDLEGVGLLPCGTSADHYRGADDQTQGPLRSLGQHNQRGIRNFRHPGFDMTRTWYFPQYEVAKGTWNNREFGSEP